MFLVSDSIKLKMQTCPRRHQKEKKRESSFNKVYVYIYILASPKTFCKRPFNSISLRLLPEYNIFIINKSESCFVMSILYFGSLTINALMMASKLLPKVSEGGV